MNQEDTQTMIDETFHIAIGLYLNLQFPLVEKGHWSNDESSFACWILRLIPDNQGHPERKRDIKDVCKGVSSTLTFE